MQDVGYILFITLRKAPLLHLNSSQDKLLTTTFKL